ncbi:uncharacterized protein HD556DRAFT_1306753 [Suillus plorans]|uniref:phosphatidyl-N-methylethanolamine N-methyltransferase n=1 Tax=Suillus plorans TaxID=116603 RepID=A0A9P7DKJ5_9AGAM|nr:uncharacterized protein HD556DRAFT_1306753 [Suillus plorans]KAG1797059.1 hypothetical protein HD556DRAFT_1306753 [Suillus plorans]
MCQDVLLSYLFDITFAKFDKFHLTKCKLCIANTNFASLSATFVSRSPNIALQAAKDPKFVAPKQPQSCKNRWGQVSVASPAPFFLPTIFPHPSEGSRHSPLLVLASTHVSFIQRYDYTNHASFKVRTALYWDSEYDEEMMFLVVSDTWNKSHICTHFQLSGEGSEYGRISTYPALSHQSVFTGPKHQLECYSALSDQPQVPMLSTPYDILILVVLFAIGQLFVVTSTWALGITGTFLGDYFGILMDHCVQGFPFNVLRDPMYERPAGLLHEGDWAVNGRLTSAWITIHQ